MRVGDIAAGRAGDKGSALDLSLVAADGATYAHLRGALTAERVEQILAVEDAGPVTRYELPGLLALKFVAPRALSGGVFASLHAGIHWQKAAIYHLLDHEIVECQTDTDSRRQP